MKLNAFSLFLQIFSCINVYTVKSFKVKEELIFIYIYLQGAPKTEKMVFRKSETWLWNFRFKEDFVFPNVLDSNWWQRDAIKGEHPLMSRYDSIHVRNSCTFLNKNISVLVSYLYSAHLASQNILFHWVSPSIQSNFVYFDLIHPWMIMLMGVPWVNDLISIWFFN